MYFSPLFPSPTCLLAEKIQAKRAQTTQKTILPSLPLHLHPYPLSLWRKKQRKGKAEEALSSMPRILQILILCTYHVASSFAFFATHIHSPVPPPRTRSLLIMHATVSTTTGTSKRTAPSEVVSMFDEFASYFESKLVDTLKYSTPLDVSRTASQRIDSEHRQGRKYKSILDAGCGTGLSGPYLHQHRDGGPLIGVDLSPKMAELAAELVVDDGPTPVVEDRMRRCSETARLALGADKARDRLYDGVFTADLLDMSNPTFLGGYGHPVSSFPTEPFELIVSADVLCYFGEMGTILQAFADRLAVGGDLIFSTETLAEGDYNWVRLLGSERYAHCPAYVERMANEAGLVVVSQEAFTPRLEAGDKVLGTLHTFTKQ